VAFLFFLLFYKESGLEKPKPEKMRIYFPNHFPIYIIPFFFALFNSGNGFLSLF